MKPYSPKPLRARSIRWMYPLLVFASCLAAAPNAAAQNAAMPAGPQNPADILRQAWRSPVYVVPGPSELSTLYFDGSEIEIQTEGRWRFMCGSDLSGVTLEDLIHCAETHDALVANGPDIIVDSGPRSGAIDIVYNLTGLPAEAVSAFAMAEAYIESQFSDNITVVLNCSYVSLGGGVLGATVTNYVTNLTYTASRNGLQTGMDADDVVQAWLPDGTTVPVRYDGSSPTITDENRISWAKANYRATVGTVSGQAAGMQYDADTNWDWDPSNGVGGFAFSFVDVVIHETGHALGFVSAVDDQNQTMQTLDLFRFQRTDDAYNYNPDTYEDFQTTPRLVSFNSPSGAHIVDVISAEYRMADGDPYQASHFSESVLAIMSPAFATGETFYPDFYRTPDVTMFDAIGYDYPPCDAPDVTVQPDPNQFLCEAESFTLHVATDAPDCTYQWRKGPFELVDDGVHIAGATTDTLQVFDASVADAGDDYNCRITDPTGCFAVSDYATVNVDPSPTITDQPDDVVADEGAYATFSVTVSDAFVAYQWRKDGSPLADSEHILGSATQQLLVLSLVPGDAGAYDCVVTFMLEPFCSRTSATAMLTVNSPGCPNPGASGEYCLTDIFPNNGDGVWNYADDGDCLVNIGDLGLLLSHYGMTSGATRETGDVYPLGTGDGQVTLADLSQLLSQYGDDCN